MESITIGSDKCRNFSELVDLKILSRETLLRLSLNNLEFDIVGFRNCADGSRAGVTLHDEKEVSQMPCDEK